MTEPKKAISDWNLNYNLGCAVIHILNSREKGRNGELRDAIKCLEEEVMFNEEKELERFKAFADKLSESATQP